MFDRFHRQRMQCILLFISIATDMKLFTVKLLTNPDEACSNSSRLQPRYGHDKIIKTVVIMMGTHLN